MPVFTIRPYTTVGDWAAVGGGSIADDSDASYLRFDNPYQYGEAQFDLSLIPWGSGVVVRSVTLRARTRTNSSFPITAQMFASNTAGRTIITPGDRYQLSVASASFANQSAGAKSIVLVQSDGQLRFLVNATGTGGGVTVDFAEMWLDIDTAYPPLPTVNKPTGTYTATSAPQLQWSFFSQDAYPQTAFRYLIYTSAQVAGTGFVPGVTPPTYDSGVVFSTNRNVTLPAFVNGSYRVYVAVAQTVNGQLQWSAWTNTSNSTYKDYTLAITPPAAPTISVSGDNTNARVSVTVTGAGAANSILDVYQIERSFDVGITWELVRGDNADGYIEAVGGVRVWYDYETANGESVIYRARTITADSAGNTLVGAWSSNSSNVSWTSTSSWLKVVTDPGLNRTIIIRSFGDEQYAVPMGTFQGLDSSEAVTIVGVRRSRPDASIVLLSQTTAEEDAIRAILEQGVPVLIHASSRSSHWGGESRYLQVGVVRVSRPTRAGWSHLRDIGMPYTEVDRPDPTVYLVGFGQNTWQDLDDQFASFTALNAAFATYAAIRG
jgi:hypothetical protein